MEKIIIKVTALLLPCSCLLTVDCSNGFSNVAIQKLREIVLPKIRNTSFVRNWTNDDLYLFKWLDVNSMDVSRAARSLLDHVNWREVNRIDDIDGESRNCSRFDIEYPYFTGQHDKMGRPVSEMWMSEWDLRKAIIAGLRKSLTLWLLRMAELQQRNLYEARAKGRNVTHAIILMDVEGFNLFTIACRSCLQLFQYWGMDWTKHYPDLYGKIIVVNSTPTIHVLWTVMRAAFRRKDAESLQVYTGEKTWKPRLDEVIDRNQRSVRFGGTLRLGCQQ